MTTVPWPPPPAEDLPDAPPPAAFLAAARPFPEPGGYLLALFALWQDEPDPGAGPDQGPDHAMISAPFDPAGLPEDTRPDLHRWLRQVVNHLNWAYGRDPAHTIAPCWDRHPYLVSMLTVLAAARLEAFAATSATPATTWTLVTLPAFYRELAADDLARRCRHPNAHAD